MGGKRQGGGKGDNEAFCNHGDLVHEVSLLLKDCESLVDLKRGSGKIVGRRRQKEPYGFYF